MGQIIQEVEKIELTDEVLEHYLANPDLLYQDQEKVLPIENKYIGYGGVNSSSRYNSISRLGMLGSLQQKSVTLVDGEEATIQNGVMRALGETCFNIKITIDSTFMGYATRRWNSDMELIVLFLKDKNGYNYRLEVPPIMVLEKGFGFALTQTELLKDVIRNKGYKLKDGDILATSPSYNNGGYAAYANANVCFGSWAVLDQDAIVISDRLSKKLRHKRYREFNAVVNKDEIPLNIHGDDKTYKTLLQPGEYIPDDGILFAKRGEVNKHMVLDRMLRSPTLGDEVIYNKYGKGKVIHVDVVSPRVVPKSKLGGDVTEQIRNFSISNKAFSHAYADAVSSIERHEKKWRGAVITEFVTHEVVRKQINAKLINNKTVINNYYITIVVEYDSIGKETSKLTTDDGGKGLVTTVLPLEQMPRDESGEYADILIHKKSTMNRMIMSRGYNAPIAGSIYRVGKYIKDTINSVGRKNYYKDTKLVNSLFQEVIDINELCGNGYAEHYRQFTLEEKIEELNHIFGRNKYVDNQLTVDIDIANPLKMSTIMKRLEEAGKMVPRSTITQLIDDKLITYDKKMRIGRIPVILINKMADDGMASATVPTSYIGRPISTKGSAKDLNPWNFSTVRTLAESDLILTQGAIGTLGSAELLDRTGNLETTKALTEAMFTDEPTKIKVAIDRKKIPFGNTIVQKADEHIYSLSGYKPTYVKSKFDDSRKRLNKKIQKDNDEIFKEIINESKNK